MGKIKRCPICKAKMIRQKQNKIYLHTEKNNEIKYLPIPIKKYECAICGLTYIKYERGKKKWRLKKI